MKFLISLCTVLIAYSTSFADCRGQMDSEYGSFEVVSNLKATTECRSANKLGRLDLPGCLVEFKSLNKSANKGKIRKVYVNPEFCNLKTKKVVKLWVIQECCDSNYSLQCEDHKNGLYAKGVDDLDYTCKAESGYFVKEIEIKQEGKPSIRHYNREANDFININKKNPGPPSITNEEFKKLKAQQ